MIGIGWSRVGCGKAEARLLRGLAYRTTAATLTTFLLACVRCHGFGSFSSKTTITTMAMTTTTTSSSSIGSKPSTSTSEEDLTPSMTKDALEICYKAIDAVSPYTAIRQHFIRSGNILQTLEGRTTTAEYDLTAYDQVVIVAFGKASSAMATATLEQLQLTTKETKNDPSEKYLCSNINIRGLVVVKDDHETQEERKILEANHIQIRSASHPVPDERSVSAAQQIMDLVRETASPRTLLICCISGGGSALFCSPRPPLSLQDLQDTNVALLQSGLSIQEMNIIRKRLEQGKGGRLAAAAYPSTVLTLVLSDVLGDPLDLIASGPTVPDTSTKADARRLVQGMTQKNAAVLPSKVMELLQINHSQHNADNESDDLKDDDTPSPHVFENTKTILVGNNEIAVRAAAREAHSRGYNTIILGTQIEGEAKYIANMYTAMAQHLAQQKKQTTRDNDDSKNNNNDNNDECFDIKPLPVALIGGGETTVSLPHDNQGMGGRNQELVLSAAIQLNDLQLQNVVIASVGTDGTDGPTDAAGAVADASTVDLLDGSAHDALSAHDAYNYFDQTITTSTSEESSVHSPLIRTGPTGTNVADICVTLIR